jgi:hypothetical protein
LVIYVLAIATSIFYLSLDKAHLNCCGATITSPTLLIFHFLSFAKAIEFHSFKIVAMEEQVSSLLRLDKPKTTV